MSADAGADEVDRRPGDERRGRAALAHGLLREAVDCIKQARDLIGDEDSSTTLGRNCDELMAVASRLADGCASAQASHGESPTSPAQPPSFRHFRAAESCWKQ